MSSACWVCSSTHTLKWSDHVDGHTLLEDFFRCYSCGYVYHFAYGMTEVDIGDFHATWSYTQPYLEEAVYRSDQVARFIRRLELGMLPEDERGFAAALKADPADFTTSGAYADWLDDHGRDKEAFYFRRYNDARWFGRSGDGEPEAVDRGREAGAPEEAGSGGGRGATSAE